MAEQAFDTLEEQCSTSDSGCRGQSTLEKSSTPGRRLRYWWGVTVRLRLRRLRRLDRSRRRRRWRRRALWLSVRLAASEKAGHPCEKAPARRLGIGRRLFLGKLFLKTADSTLRVGHSLLHHEKALDQHVRSRRNLSDLAPDQLISFGIFALATSLAEPIEQTGYEIMFFGCHSLKKTLFSTLTSLGRAKFKRSCQGQCQCQLPVLSRALNAERRHADTFPLRPLKTVFARADE